MTLKIAHRGASGYETENSLPSFRKAIALKSDYIELDVRFTSDGIPVVNHGSTINGLFIKKTEFAKLKESKKDLFTLQEILWRLKDKIKLIVDLKDSAHVGSICKLILKNNLESQVVISSNDHKTLKFIKENYPSINRFLIFPSPKLYLFKYFLKYFPYRFLHPIITRRVNHAGATSLHIEKSLVSRKLVKNLSPLGIDVYVWTVNQKYEIAHFKKIGVKGIYSDFPDLI